MSQLTCPECFSNHFKEMILEHSFPTRDSNRSHMKIENLPVLECVICGEVILTEKSEEIIRTVKEMVHKELVRSAEMEKLALSEIEQQSIFSKIFTTLFRK